MEENLIEKYHNLKDETNKIVWEMKVYILNNYQNIDFSNFSGSVYSNYNNNSQTFGPEPITLFDKYLMDFEQVKSVTDVVLDECDGDFSITINGVEYWWISDDSVCELYGYIFENKNQI